MASRFERSEDLADISGAISALRRAIQLTPQGRASLPVMLNNLGNSLRTRFDHTEDPVDITEAISVQQRAVQLTPDGHANLSSWHFSLGVSLYKRSVQTSSSEDVNMSISHLQSSATSNIGAPKVRLEAAQCWAWLSNGQSPVSPDVLSAFNTFIHLLTLVVGLEQTSDGRQTSLRNAQGVVSTAIAAACQLQRPDKAVEWLEQSRCLVWREINNLRTPLDDLQAHDNQLAQHLVEISRQLESAPSARSTLDPSMDATVKPSLEDEARSHLSLTKGWDNVLSTVRGTPGFESFLQPSPCSTLLQHLPESGSVVIIMVTQERCDAIALSTALKQPLHIPLPTFSLQKANQYRRALSTQLQCRGIRMREEDAKTDGEIFGIGMNLWTKALALTGTLAVRDVLRGLWVEVAKPILDALKYSVSAAYCMLSLSTLTVTTALRCGGPTKDLVVSDRRRVLPPYTRRRTVHRRRF